MAPASSLFLRYRTCSGDPEQAGLGSLGQGAYGGCAIWTPPHGREKQTPETPNTSVAKPHPRCRGLPSPSSTWGVVLGTYLVFDALLVVIPHPLVALSGIGDLLTKESMDRGSAEKVTDLNREQGRRGVGSCAETLRVTRGTPQPKSLSPLLLPAGYIFP